MTAVAPRMADTGTLAAADANRWVYLADHVAETGLKLEMRTGVCGSSPRWEVDTDS